MAPKVEITIRKKDFSSRFRPWSKGSKKKYPNEHVRHLAKETQIVLTTTRELTKWEKNRLKAIYRNYSTPQYPFIRLEQLKEYLHEECLYELEKAIV